MVRYKFLLDIERCIKCGGCEVSCKRHNAVPPGVRRIRVVTVNEGKPGEFNVPLPCLHCSKPPCLYACPVGAIWQRDDGIVLVDKERCIGCGYCLYACPFGVPQFPRLGIWGYKGAMDKCTFCETIPASRVNAPPSEEWKKLVAEKKVPACAAFCATGALMAGDAADVSRAMRTRAATKLGVRKKLVISP